MIPGSETVNVDGYGNIGLLAEHLQIAATSQLVGPIAKKC
jgi:hypothetical protein